MRSVISRFVQKVAFVCYFKTARVFSNPDLKVISRPHQTLRGENCSIEEEEEKEKEKEGVLSAWLLAILIPEISSR
jgi:hypothetical protein